MTYSQKVRSCLFSSFEHNLQAERAFLYGAFKATGEITITNKGKYLSIKSFNFDFLRFISTLIKEFNGSETEIEIKNAPYPNKGKMFILRVNAYSSDKLLNGLFFCKDGIYDFNDTVAPEISGDTASFKAFIKGIFASCGSIYIPTGAKGENAKSKGGYHLELSLKSRAFAENIVSLLSSYDLTLKLIERSDEHFMLYAKDGETIKDFLAFMDLSDLVIELCELMLSREISKEANRLTNCNIANISKTVDAAEKQLNAILFLKEKGEFGRLSEKLRQTAELRLNNPEASLDEIAAMLGDGTKKSGVNHRFRKIMELYESVKEGENG